MCDELGIAPSDDPKAIRRAYAARLKTLDPDREPFAFARLREALEWALAAAEDEMQAWSDVRSPGRDAALKREDALDLSSVQAADDEWLPREPARPKPQARGEDSAVGAGENFEIAKSERALLDSLESALERHDAVEAVKLYSRAAATGVVPLQDTPAALERLFAVVIDDLSIGPAVFRALARGVGWDRPSQLAEGSSGLRQRVLSRLAAEDWYDLLVAKAARRAGETRKQARLARLLLRKSGWLWWPRVDRAALKLHLDQYRVHETWLCDRIAPAWARRLERWWRRREIITLALYGLFLIGILIDAVYVLVKDGAESLRSPWTIVVVLSVAVFVWVLKLLSVSLWQLLRPKPLAAGPPDDPRERLSWLERQAELAYEAMYDAPAGSSAAARYNDVKEFLHDAIALAQHLGLTETAGRLSRRLADIKTIARTQFFAA